MRPKIRQWFESWFFRTDHWIGHDQAASHKLERIAEKAYRAGFEKGRAFAIHAHNAAECQKRGITPPKF